MTPEQSYLPTEEKRTPETVQALPRSTRSHGPMSWAHPYYGNPDVLGSRASSQPRSDFASDGGSLDRRSLSRKSLQSDEHNHRRGRSPYARRRRSPGNSPVTTIPSQNSRVHSKPYRRRRRFSDSPDNTSFVDRSRPWAGEPLYSYTMASPKMSLYASTYPTFPAPPVVSSVYPSANTGRHDFISPRQARPQYDSAGPTRLSAPSRSGSVRSAPPLPAPTFGQSEYPYSHPFAYHQELAREEPRYVPATYPFASNLARNDSRSPSSSPVIHSQNPSPGSNGYSSGPDHTSNTDDSLPLPGSSPARQRRPVWRWNIGLRRKLFSVLDFIFIEIPSLVYLYLLLRLPLLYFSRVSRLFEDANLSLPDIRRLVVANADQWKDGTPGSLMTTLLPPDAAVPPHLLNFRHSWEGFIDSLLREWKTQNVVAALMLSAILTMLQIDAAASDPVARTTAILSLISALMSLLFGSMYIMRFGTMRKMYKAASWAVEAQKETTSVMWNVWILLAVPAVWLAWSIILFVTCIMAFAWRTGAMEDPVSTALSNNVALGLRIGVSAVLAVALVYFFLIVKTLREYGDAMDKKWNEKVIGWAREGVYARITADPQTWERTSLENRTTRRTRPSRSSPDPQRRGSRPGQSARAPRHRRSPMRSQSPENPPMRSTAASFDRPFYSEILEYTPFPAVKIMDLPPNSSGIYALPNLLRERDILVADWLKFTRDLSDVWNGINRETPPFPIDVEHGVPPLIGPREWAAGFIHLWNNRFFHTRCAEAVICQEEPSVGPPGYAVYLIRWSRYSGVSGPMPSPQDHDLKAITIITLVEDPNGWQWGVKTRIDADPRQPKDDAPLEPDARSSQSFSARQPSASNLPSPRTQTRTVEEQEQRDEGCAQEPDAQPSPHKSILGQRWYKPSTFQSSPSPSTRIPLREASHDSLVHLSVPLPPSPQPEFGVVSSQHTLRDTPILRPIE
ncbi:hypothetical protein MSAN_01231100 [Mycena sanguinolenta]|uniref:Uncharacterized protein n=1 Tax=Mycena sanguinolenta TaxID=230812 RepID=A0A8H6YGX8_9AGAR|nr:hypothetical protein MSAN_01231100 [Mycena sanguinolenta]